MNGLRRSTASCATLVLLLVACAGQPAVTPQPTKVVSLTVAYASVSGTQAAAWVAKERGLFTKYGIDATLISIAGGSSPTGALLAGEIQALQISVEAISASLEGADIVYVAAPVSSPLFWFVAGPAVSGAADLKGKSIAMTAVGSATYFADVIALQKLGLDPKKDVTLVSVNSVPAILTAIQSGQVAAGALSMPTYFQAKKLGLKTLLNVADQGFQYPSSWLAVRKSYLESHRSEVGGLVKATTEAIAFEIRNPKETMAIIGQYTKQDDQALLQETYDTLVPYLNKVPLPKPEQVAAALRLLADSQPKANGADPKNFVDTSFVEELQKSGFIDALYR